MDSPTDFIPESLMYADKLQDVMAFLVRQPLPGYIKREYFFSWARSVNVRLKYQDVVFVETSQPQGEARR
jgi:hypothetical protein